MSESPHLPSSSGRSPGSSLPGRSGDLVQHSRESPPLHSAGDSNPSVLGLDYQFREVTNFPHTEPHMVGHSLELTKGPVEDPPHSTVRHYTTSGDSSAKEECITPTVGELCRQISICLPNTQGPTAPQSTLGSPTVDQHCSVQGSGSPSPSFSPLTPQTMDQSCHLQTGAVLLTSPYAHNLDRCIELGLGSSFFDGPSSPGSLVPQRKEPPHKSPGDKGSSPCPTKFPSPQHLSVDQDRQRSHSPLSIEKFLEEFLAPGGVDKDFDFLPNQQNSPLGLKDTFTSELCSRPPQQGFPPEIRVESTTRRVPTDPQVAWPSGSGSDGNPIQQPTSEICLPLPPPTGGSSGCSNNLLVNMEAPLHFSPSSTSVHHHYEAEQLPSPRRTDCTKCALPTVAPTTSSISKKDLAPLKATHSRSPRPVDRGLLPLLRDMDRLQFLRYLWSKHGEQVANDLCNSLRPSSIKQYESCWKRFKQWLPADTNTVDLSLVLQYLSYLRHDVQFSTTTINTHRQALSEPLSLAFNINFEDKAFSLLTRSQFIHAPPSQASFPKWNLQLALEHFQGPTYDNHGIKLKALFLKALFLTALASGNRASELQHFMRNGLQMVNNRVYIPVKPGFLFKNQTVTRTPAQVNFPSLLGPHPLCPARVLTLYIERTVDTQNAGFLFVHPKSGLPLASGRINHWMAQAIFTATGHKGKAHDIRKVAHTLGARSTSISAQLGRGFWNTPNVFIQHYLGDIPPPQLQCVAGGVAVSP